MSRPRVHCFRHLAAFPAAAALGPGTLGPGTLRAKTDPNPRRLRAKLSLPPAIGSFKALGVLPVTDGAQLLINSLGAGPGNTIMLTLGSAKSG